MNLKQARIAIEAILEAIDDEALPKPDRLEQDGETTLAWFGSTGYHLGSGRNGWGEHIPGAGHRERGSWDAVQQEALQRLDERHPKAPTYERKSDKAAS